MGDQTMTPLIAPRTSAENRNRKGRGRPTKTFKQIRITNLEAIARCEKDIKHYMAIQDVQKIKKLKNKLNTHKKRLVDNDKQELQIRLVNRQELHHDIMLQALRLVLSADEFLRFENHVQNLVNDIESERI